MSDRARDIVRYIKAIEETGGFRTQFVGAAEDGGIVGLRVTSRDRMRAEMLDLASMSDEELLEGFRRAGLEPPSLSQVRETFASYR